MGNKLLTVFSEINFLLIIKIIVVGFVIYLFNLVRVVLKERKIKEIDRAEEEEIATNATAPIKEIWERQVTHIRDKCKSKRAILERDRRFILDKLPFFRR